MLIHRGKIDCEPGEVQYDARALDVLDAHCLNLINKGTIRAAVYVLARDGKVFAHRSLGKISENGDDFLPDCIRPIASITKSFTAVGVLQLMEAGKLFLNQPVSSIIGEFDTDMHRHITIFQLLTHTSGLKSGPGCYFEPYPEEWDANLTRENWIRKTLSGPLEYKPGTRWSYCSMGYAVLAEIIARVSGQDYDRYIEERIFAPLGMESTFFFVPEDLRRKVCSVSEWNDWMLGRKREENSIPSLLGSGSIFSTAHDLYKFGQMIVNGGTYNGQKILGRKTVEAAIRPQAKEYPTSNWRPHMFDDVYKISWGFGFEVNKFPFLSEGTVDHDGAEGALLFMDPKERFVFSGFFPAPRWHGESWVSPLAIAWSGIE